MRLLDNLLFFLLLLGIIVHAKLYEGGKESDILIRQKKAVVQKNLKFDLPIKYYIGPFLNHTSIKKAIQRIEKYTCIKFKRSDWYILGKKGINFKSSYKCYSPFGPTLQPEDHLNHIYISKLCKNNAGMIEILIGTMLGLVFEHNRPDRDDYVVIHEKNINPKYLKNFNKYNSSEVSTYGFQYDFYSGLHIFYNNFSRNDDPVIETNRNYTLHNFKFGQLYGLSFNDHKILFAHYCRKNAYAKKHMDRMCNNYGYPDPNPTGMCICPNGFQGDYCDDPIKHQRACGNDSILHATFEEKQIRVGRKGRCSFIIKSHRFRTAVKIRVVKSVTRKKYPCYPNKGNEIKYKWDKGTTGLTLCGNYSNISVISDDSTAVVIYNGLDDSSELIFSYSLYNFRSTTTAPSITTTKAKTKTTKKPCITRKTKKTKKPNNPKKPKYPKKPKNPKNPKKPEKSKKTKKTKGSNKTKNSKKQKNQNKSKKTKKSMKSKESEKSKKTKD